VIDGASSASPSTAREQRVALDCEPHRGDELIRRRRLQQEAAGARAERLVDVLVEVEGREDDDLRRRGRAVAQDPSRLEPVQPRHPDVHQHDVGLQVASELDRLGAVARLADHLDVRFRLEDQPEAGADERLVVGEQDPNHAAPAPSGSRALTE